MECPLLPVIQFLYILFFINWRLNERNYKYNLDSLLIQATGMAGSTAFPSKNKRPNRIQTEACQFEKLGKNAEIGHFIIGLMQINQLIIC